MLDTEAHYHTDRGRREDNEDCAVVLEEGRVCAVADGMGGMGGGGLASSLVMAAVRDSAESGELDGLDGRAAVFETLERIFRDANRRILDTGRDDPGLWNMGTTLTLAVIREHCLYFAHLGDSRLYLWREGCCTQLTEDHSQTEEFLRQGWLSPDDAAVSRYQNVLVKYLGTTRRMDPHIGTQELKPGDRILICSDGLYREIAPDRLRLLLGDDRPAGELAGELVAAALANGNAQQDNITALVIRLHSG